MSSGKAIDNLSRGVGDINLDGHWEEVSRKQKGRAGKPWRQQTSTPKAWGQPDTAQRLGMRSANASGSAWNSLNNDVRRQGGGGLRPQSFSSEGNDVTRASAIAPPLERGWNWAARAGLSQVEEEKTVDKENADEEEEDEDEDNVYTDDDDDLLSDDYDSDDGPQTHETKKQHRMLKGFFEILDKLTVPEINDPVRQWHCPACQGGPGAIDWYKGLQPLITHARTKGSVRVKLHREFANILDEEFRRRGTSVVPAGESFGQWEGLKQEIKDHDIVWPPMVVIMNTVLEKDENDKWLGMGNQELLDYFREYAAVKARHSYGPKGHRGMSVLIFESSAMGYVDAERLHKHFLGQGTGRSAWESNRRVLFYPGGKRQLYGFLARNEDLEEFNRHCQGKTKLKYDIRSYHETVVGPMKQMNEDNQHLTYFKNKVAKEQRNAKALEESLTIVSQKLRVTMEENRLVRQRTKEQHEQNKKEMEAQEEFYSMIAMIQESTKAKEDNFEKFQQDLRKQVEASDKGDPRRRGEEVTKLKRLQEQEMEKFVTERDELMEKYKNKRMEMKRRHWEEELELVKEFDANLTNLMDKYAPPSAEGSAVESSAAGNA